MSSHPAKIFASRIVLLGLLIFSGPGFAQTQADPIVCLQTSKGPIYIRVYLRIAPNTAHNFLDLVNRGFYNGLCFHRVENWVVQGGDPNSNGTGVYIDPQTSSPRYVPLERNSHLKHNAPGVVAMAHGPNPNSNSCQFYITKRTAQELDGQYSIFAGVVNGLEIVYSLAPGDRIISASMINKAETPSKLPEPAASQPIGESGF